MRLPRSSGSRKCPKSSSESANQEPFSTSTKRPVQRLCRCRTATRIRSSELSSARLRKCYFSPCFVLKFVQ